jgi:hypothetical protein
MTLPNWPKVKFNPEMLVGVSAVVIGVCALAVSIYETGLMREQQRAAVIPMLELGRSYFLTGVGPTTEEPRLWLHAQNVGIGPARIVDFRVTVDGKAKPTWDAAMRALLNRDQPVSYSQSTINGRTIPPERTVTMFELNDTELSEQILAEFERLDFEACYCSIFDECWTTRYSTFGIAEQVESCSRSVESFGE